jgi:hypothetical protein
LGFSHFFEKFSLHFFDIFEKKKRVNSKYQINEIMLNLKQEMEDESKTEQNGICRTLEKSNQIKTEQTSVASVDFTSVDENDPSSESSLPFVPSLSEVTQSSSNGNLTLEKQNTKVSVPKGSRPNRSRQLPSRFDVINKGDQNEVPTSPTVPPLPNLSMDIGSLGDNEAHVYSMIYQHLHANISNGNAGTPSGLNRQFSPLVGFSAEKNMEHSGVESIVTFPPNNIASALNREEDSANVATFLPPLDSLNGQVFDSRTSTLNHQQIHSQDQQQQQKQYFNNPSNRDVYSQQMPMQLMSFGPYGLQPIFASNMNHIPLPHLQGMSSFRPNVGEQDRNTTSATTSSSKKRKAPDPNKKPRKPQKRFMNSNDQNGDFGAKRDGKTRLTTNQPRKVEVLDMNRNRLHLFESCSEASRVMNVNRTRISRVCRGGGGELSGKIYRYIEGSSHTDESMELLAPAVAPVISNASEEIVVPPPLPPVVEYIALEPTVTDEHERDVLEEVDIDDDDGENLFV